MHSLKKEGKKRKRFYKGALQKLTKRQYNGMKMNEEFTGIKNKLKNVDLIAYFIALKKEKLLEKRLTKIKKETMCFHITLGLEHKKEKKMKKRKKKIINSKNKKLYKEN